MAQNQQTSRRALLTAAAGSAAALAASTLALPAQVVAGSDGDVVLGGPNTTSSKTSINATVTGDAFFVQTNYNGHANTAIAAFADSTAAGAGVHGHGTICPGVLGTSENGGPGVYGYSNIGIGVLASAPLGYPALWVEGRSHFRLSGRTSMTAGHSTFTKTLTGVTSSSIVIAVLQTNESGISVRAAVPSTGKFVVYLTKALTSSAVVGWIVLN